MILNALRRVTAALSEIRFTIDRRSRMSVMLYDVLGRLVRSLEPPTPFGPGSHGIVWDGTDRGGRPAPAGLYLAEVRSAGRSARTKILRLR
jgi:hypothetical protein